MKRHYFQVFVIICAVVFSSVVSFGQESEDAVFFTVQVGSYSNEARAREYRDALIEKNYPAYISALPNPAGKPVYKLRMGKFKTRKEAEALGMLFQKREKMDCLIVSTEPIKRTLPALPPQAPPHTAPSVEKTEIPSPPPAAPPSMAFEPRGREPEKKPVEALDTAAPLIPVRETIPWPESRSTICVYRGEDENLHVTNRVDRVPEHLKSRIESVSTFPVAFLAFEPEQGTLRIDVEGKEESVKLIGIAFPSAEAIRSATSYFEKNLRGVPLRFEYSPAQREVSGSIRGRLGFREGKGIGLELIRQGIASFAAVDVPVSQRSAFEAAEAAARREKIGIWALSSEAHEK